MTISVSGVDDVGSATFHGSNGGLGAYDLTSTGDLVIQGSVSIDDTGANDDLVGVHTEGSSGTPTLDIAVGGSLEVSSTGSGSSAYGFYSGSAPASFTNNGTLTVSSASGANAVSLGAGGTFVNAGTLSASTSDSSTVQAVFVAAPATVSNSGSIAASGGGEADGLVLSGGGTFTNGGTITATSTAGTAYGITVYDTTGDVTTIVNTGSITAAWAISFSNTLGPGPTSLTNSGTINGGVFLGEGPDDYLRNTGLIDGSVGLLGESGTQIYDGRGGTQIGGIGFATGAAVHGAEIAYLGNDGESVNGGSGFLTAYGGTGNDTMVGGLGGAFLTGGGGNDEFVVNTGDTNAETIAFRVLTGSDTIISFSGGAGDQIDLSALGVDWATVQANAVTSGSNTVITLGGLTITLVGVTSLQQSEFVFGTVSVLPTDDFAIDPSVTISLTTGPLAIFTGAGGALDNKGSMTLSAGSVQSWGVKATAILDDTAVFTNDGSFSVTGSVVTGVENGVTLHNNGTFAVVGTTGVFTIGASGDVVNSGTMTVTGTSGTYGVRDIDPNAVFQNLASATLSVTSTAGFANGVLMFGAQDFENAGQITVSATSSTNGLDYYAGAGANTIVNSGSLTANGAEGVGIHILTIDGATSVSVNNSGTITAIQAIVADIAANITNTGVIDGQVDFNVGATATNVLDSHAGTITGLILISSSANVTLGAENNTVEITQGTNSVDGGGGTNTVSYANALAGVTVSLALQGQIQATGAAGVDNLSNFQDLTGSSFNDTLTGDSHDNVLTGGAGADTFVFLPGGGNDTVADFSQAQGDKIDLSALHAFFSLADVLVAATDVGSNTVIDLGGGNSVTLDSVQKEDLTASDFVFAPIVVSTPGDVVTIGAGESLSSTGVIIEFRLPGFTDATVINDGSLTLSTSTPANLVAGQWGTFKNYGTVSYSAGGGAFAVCGAIDNYGSITVAGTQEGWGVTGNLVNSGTFSVQGSTLGIGAEATSLVQNLLGGTLAVASTAGQVTGALFNNGGEFDNAGAMTVTGSALAYGVYVTRGELPGPSTSYALVNNSGTLTVSGSTSIGVEMWGFASVIIPSGQYNVINSGTITAQTAIQFSSSPTTVGLAAAVDNSGILNGAVQLSVHDDRLLNTGTIAGAVNMGDGNDTLDSHAGTINGVVTLGSGSSTVTLGGEANIVDLAAGTHIVDAGGGINTVSYVDASSGVHVSLALQGQAQVTGVGADTLSHFQALVGSNNNDTLEGGGSGASTLTGGLGADTFVFRPGEGAVTVADFYATQGDTIDLTAFTTLHTLADVLGLASSSGPDTVLALPGGGSVTLQGVAIGDLTRSDFAIGSTPADLYGTGQSDILFQNNGQLAVWSLNGTALSGAFVPTVAAGWVAQDTGDFNGDGMSGDVFFRNPATGQSAIWDMSGTQIVGSALLPTAPTSWQVQGTGDFNGDGMSDVLWRDGASGSVAIWEMNGTQIQSSAIVTAVSSDWHAVGVADFNGDGMADMLWKDAATGQVAVWEMNGTQITSAAIAVTAPTSWHVAGTGDFDGDGKADILLRDQASGAVAIWEMDGLALKAAAIVTTVSADWQVAGTADVNGDGMTDILWRNSAGQVAVWDMHGFSIASSSIPGQVAGSWSILNHHYDWV